MATKIQVRRDLAAQWSAVNPVLAAGEFGYATDSGELKLGDGTSRWAQLEVIADQDGVFLSKAADAGAQTVEAPQGVEFTGITTHDRGVSVTGGNGPSVINGITGDLNAINIIADRVQAARFAHTNGGGVQTGLFCGGPDNQLSSTANVTGCFTDVNMNDNVVKGATYYGHRTRGDFSNTADNSGNATAGGNFVGYNAYASAGDRATSLKGFSWSGASVLHPNDADAVAYGFYSDQNVTANGNAYNFYAAGTAPSYFRGEVIVGADPIAPVGTAVGLSLVGGNNPRIYSACTSTTSSIFANTTTTGGPVMQFRIADGAGGVTNCGNITVTAAGGVNYVDNSDYRLKSNIQPLSSVADALKALKPCTYTRNNVDGIVGFIAHEVQEQFPQAVVGTKDATEAIGTMTNAEGAVTTDVTEPEAIADGETWVQTGTRPVYQGVDQTKLIPVLTKALQEALERIEVLEKLNGY